MSRDTAPNRVAQTAAPVCTALFVSGSERRPLVRRTRDDFELRIVDARVSDATDFLRRLPLLALAWVDESAGPEARALVAALKTLEPTLPVIWSARSGSGKPLELGPDRILLGPVDFNGASATIAELLDTAGYSAAIVDTLYSASADVLTLGFNIPAPTCETFFKATRSPLASVSAAVEFSGPDVDACVIVSAETKPLRDMLRISVPGAVASLAALHDLAGEMANHIVGRLKVALDPAGAVFDQHKSLVLRGNEANIRALRGRRSLVLRLVASNVELSVQFSIKGKVRPSVVDTCAGPAPGELQFLHEAE